MTDDDFIITLMASAFHPMPRSEPPVQPPEPEPELGRYCDICACTVCTTPSFCNACRAADKDPQVIAHRQRALAQLPPNWDTMDFDALYVLLNNPARLSREGRQRGAAKALGADAAQDSRSA